MSISSVQKARGPRRKVKNAKINHERSSNFKLNHSNGFNTTILGSSMSNVSESSTSTDEIVSRKMLAQILLTCLQQAQVNECFQMVSQEQRNRILKNVWIELFILKASHWPIDVSQAIERVCGDRHLLEVISATKSLNVDLMELSLLEIMILCRPEFSSNNNDDEQLVLKFNSENAFTRLACYVSSSVTERRHQEQQKRAAASGKNMKMQKFFFTSTNSSSTFTETLTSRTQSVTRFGKLLLILRHLSSIRSHEVTMNNIFSDREDAGKFEEFLNWKLRTKTSLK